MKALRVVGDDHGQEEQLQLELRDPPSGAFTDPSDASVKLVGDRIGCHLGAERSRVHVEIHPDDVGFAAGEAQHARAATADEKRWVR